MKNKGIKILSIMSLFVGASLVLNSVLASYLVTDNANPLGLKIGLSTIATNEVKFLNADNTVYYSEEVPEGGTLTVSDMPASNPTLSGYTFDGWTTDTVDFVETSDNFATKTYSSSITYYPRFASYGYKTSTSQATHIPNEWQINNNIELTANTSLTLGTYIYGKTSALENATSAVTISKAGGYALVCDSHGASWDETKAGNINNWHIQKYITATRTGAWTGKNTYARFYNANDSYEDRIMQQVSGETYYAYCDYQATKVEFGAIYADSDTQDAVLDGYANIQYRTDKITLDGTTNYNIPDVAYYLTGEFASVDWNLDPNYVLTLDSSDSNHYYINNVALNAGDKLKIRDNANNWFTSSAWTGCGFTNDTDNNVVISKTGVYDINFYLSATNHLVPTAVSYQSTFTVVDDTLAANENIYVIGFSDNWNIQQQYKLTATGVANTYSLTTNVPADTTVFKFAVYNGSTTDSTKLNSGNRTYTAGENYSYTYVPSVTKYTISFNVNYGTSWGESLFVTGDFASWSCNTNYVLTWTNGNNWVGSFEFEENTEFKVVVGPSSGGAVKRWSSGGNLVADSNKTISSVSW